MSPSAAVTAFGTVSMTPNAFRVDQNSNGKQSVSNLKGNSIFPRGATDQFWGNINDNSVVFFLPPDFYSGGIEENNPAALRYSNIFDP